MTELKKDRRKKPSYRHELKYYISFAEYVMLSKKLSETLPYDEHTNQNGEYVIRSLYFDDIANTAMHEKISGVNARKKVRIRTYNGSDKLIKLEQKAKDGDYICKQSITLSRDEYESIIKREYGFLLKRSEPFAREMFAMFTTRYLKPAVIVDYIREAYVFPVQNVRITFDKDIRTAYNSIDIFDENLITYPAADSYDMVLEIKFDRYLPTYVRSLLQIIAQRSAVSKYVICRKYEL